MSIKNTLESLSVQILTARTSELPVLLADLKRILTRCRLSRRDKESLKHFPSKLVRNHTHMKAHAGTQTHTFGAQLRWVIRGGHQGNRQTQANIRYTAYLQQLSLCEPPSHPPLPPPLPFPKYENKPGIFYLNFSKQRPALPRFQRYGFDYLGRCDP